MNKHPATNPLGIFTPYYTIIPDITRGVVYYVSICVVVIEIEYLYGAPSTQMCPD